MSRDLLKLISEKFTSGNSVEVERITITRAEYEEHLAKPEPRNDAAWHWHDLYKAKCQEFHDKQTMLGTEIVALEEEIAELKEDQTEPHIVKVSMPDTQCGHCGGSGCVLCDAKFLPKPEQEPKLTDAGADTNISRGLEPKGSGMVTMNQVGMRVDFNDAPPRKPWVGLTSDEINYSICNLLEDDPNPLLTLAEVIQERLKEKNT